MDQLGLIGTFFYTYSINMTWAAISTTRFRYLFYTTSLAHLDRATRPSKLRRIWKVHIRLSMEWFACNKLESCFGHLLLYWYMELLIPYQVFLNCHNYEEGISQKHSLTKTTSREGGNFNPNSLTTCHKSYMVWHISYCYKVVVCSHTCICLRCVHTLE